MSGENDTQPLDAEQLNGLLETDGAELDGIEEEEAFLEGFDADTEEATQIDNDDHVLEGDEIKDPLEATDDISVLAAAEKADLEKTGDDKTGDDKTGDDDDPAKIVGDESGKEVDSASSTKSEKVEETDEGKLAARIRKMEGRMGNLADRFDVLQEAGAQAKQVATSEGHDTPNKKQIEEATESTEKLDALKAQFPEWGDAMEETIGLASAKILKQIPNTDALRAEMRSQMATMRATIRLDSKHEGWEDTVRSDAFLEFAHQGGPTRDERAVYYHVNSSGDEQKANTMYDGFKEDYPEWYEKFGSLLISSDPGDASKLLDQFATHEAALEIDTKPPVDTEKTRRLESNVAATRNTRTTQRVAEDTEQEAFVNGFNS